jgi:predicted dehydrogenase
MAELATVVPVRCEPTGPVETFAGAGGAPPADTVEGRLDTDDCAGILLRFVGGARGVATVSHYPTFADGHDGALVGEAIARSAREGRWIQVERPSA